MNPWLMDVVYSALIVSALFGIIYGFARLLAHWIDRNGGKPTLEIIETTDPEKEETPPLA